MSSVFNAPRLFLLPVVRWNRVENENDYENENENDNWRDDLRVVRVQRLLLDFPR